MYREALQLLVAVRILVVTSAGAAVCCWCAAEVRLHSARSLWIRSVLTCSPFQVMISEKWCFGDASFVCDCSIALVDSWQETYTMAGPWPLQNRLIRQRGELVNGPQPMDGRDGRWLENEGWMMDAMGEGWSIVEGIDAWLDRWMREGMVVLLEGCYASIYSIDGS